MNGAFATSPGEKQRQLLPFFPLLRNACWQFFSWKSNVNSC